MNVRQSYSCMYVYSYALLREVATEVSNYVSDMSLHMIIININIRRKCNSESGRLEIQLANSAEHASMREDIMSPYNH